MSHPTDLAPILARPTVRRGRAAALAVIAAMAAFVACGGDDAAGTDTGAAGTDAGAGADAGAWPAFGLVTPQQAAGLAADASVTVLDVRTPEEFAEGHLDGAVLVDVTAPSFTDEVAQLDPDRPYLVYCRSGNRSAQAVAAMEAAGFAHLWDMEGGVAAWTSAGLALVR
jgi:phage shock protein E